MFNWLIGPLLTVVLLSISIGSIFLYYGNWYGMLLLLPALVFLGVRTPNPDKQEVWLLSFLGIRTVIVVRVITILIPKIIEKNVISTEVIDINYKIEEPIRCKDGYYLKKGNISTSWRPDDKDDPIGRNGEKKKGWKTAGQKLLLWDNIGKTGGAKKQLEDISRAGYKMVAMEFEHDVLVSSPPEVEHRLRQIITGGDGNYITVDDASNFGVKFTKLRSNVTADEKVVDAANRKKVEELRRDSALEDGKTTNELIKQRIRLYYGITDPNGELPANIPKKVLDDIWEQVKNDRVIDAEKYSIIESNGKLLNQVPPQT